MIIDKAICAQSEQFVLTDGRGRWVKAEFGGTLQEGDDPIQCWLQLKSLSDKAIQTEYKKLNPLSDSSGEGIKDEALKVIQVERTGTEEELIADINSCTDLKVLESYRLLVKGKPSAQYAYDRKMLQIIS